jgi:hypothetical protein
MLMGILEKFGFRLAVIGLVLSICMLSRAAGPSSSDLSTYHSSTPAGYDVVVLRPAGATLSLLGLIECPDLEGARHDAQGVNSKIILADGNPLTYFPGSFSFRITASLRKTVISGPTLDINSSQDPKDFLLNLKFKLRAYDGLEAHEIQPESVQIIGVPPELPYDERIYRLNFKVNKMPVTDRLVMEVLSPEGQQLTRFHFDLL